ncbi:hypothetical protein N9860_03530, partial [Akkermansiaceae bacterium]|nr:hypothetical protein [Akkermansiaceae bacterium]
HQQFPPMLLRRFPSFLLEKDKRESQPRKAHPKSNQRKRPKLRRRDSHKEKGCSPKRSKQEKNKKIADAHASGVVFAVSNVKGREGAGELELSTTLDS